MAGWLIVAGSVVVVLLALDQGAALHSLKTRDAVTDYLAGSGDRVSLQDALTVLRVAITVAAASAAATAVLGWFALQRSKGARLALSWLAVPLFVSGFFATGAAGAVPAMVSAAIVMLWFQPARDWFDGITRQLPARPGPPARRDPFLDLPSPGRDPLLDLPPPTSPPLHPAPYAVRPPDLPTGTAPRVDRPASVTWACVLAWLSTAAVFGLLAVVLVAMLASPDALLDAAHRENPDLSGQGLSDAELKSATYVLCALVMVWSAAAAALALLTWRRIGWAAIGLAVSGGLASVACLVTVVGSSPAFLVPMAVCAVTVALLVRPESLAWLRT